MSFNTIRENKILAKISGFTVVPDQTQLGARWTWNILFAHAFPVKATKLAFHSNETS